MNYNLFGIAIIILIISGAIGVYTFKRQSRRTGNLPTENFLFHSDLTEKILFNLGIVSFLVSIVLFFIAL